MVKTIIYKPHVHSLGGFVYGNDANTLAILDVKNIQRKISTAHVSKLFILYQSDTTQGQYRDIVNMKL